MKDKHVQQKNICANNKKKENFPMASISFYENDKTPNGSLFTDFSDQHRNVATQFFQPFQGAGLNAGCPSIDPCPASGSCAPMFYCPDTFCPPGYVHASHGRCISDSDDISEMRKAIPK